MTSDEALRLIVKIAGLRLLVRANRFGCDNDLARHAHDSVLEMLEIVGDRFREHLYQIYGVAREADPREREELLYHFVQCDRALERHWFEVMPVGGWNPTGKDGGFINPVTRRMEFAGRSSPVGIPIPPQRLCGLPKILDEIADECSLQFALEIVFYRPWEAADGDLPF